MDEVGDGWRPEVLNAGGPKLPEVPADPMEFLSRSWTVSLLEVSKALAPLLPPGIGTAAVTIPESAEAAEDPAALFGNPFSFASAATAQLVMERILSQSQEASPRTSGRLSHSSGPLAGGQSGGSLTDSPPVSPCNMDDIKIKYHRGPATVAAATKPQPPRGRTVGRWLKDRRERKKEEARAHNAQLHAAVSVAGVAAAVAAVAAATAAASSSRTDVAVASAATLVAAQCVETAEALGAERDHLAAVVGSAVSVRTPGDVVTLTAAAATALRGAATLKARALKEVWNAAAIIPVEKNSAASGGNHHDRRRLQLETDKGVAAAAAELLPDVNHQLLARGSELLKRTRKGALHWKHVSVYINRLGQVMLKMTSRHVAGAITKKKKGVITEVCKEIAAWPGRRLLESGDLRRYFGLRMADRRVIEFECRGQREYDIWTRGVSGLLTAARERTRIP